jgi:hypothetical protein
MNRLWLALMVVVFAGPEGLGAEPGVLIRDGQSHATVVVSQQADALARRTATDLKQTLSRMTGVALPIRSDAEEVSGNRVLVGQTRWTDMVVSPDERRGLGKEGFILRPRGRDVALASGGPYGVAYAASELLERLGARWYLPGPLGEVIARMNRVQFDQLDVRQVSVLRHAKGGHRRQLEPPEPDEPEGRCLAAAAVSRGDRHLSHAIAVGATFPV